MKSLRIYLLSFLILAFGNTALGVTNQCSELFERSSNASVLPAMGKRSAEAALSAVTGTQASLKNVNQVDVDYLRTWVDFKKHEPLVSDQVKVIHYEAELNGAATKFGCGTCKMMMNTFMRSFIVPMLERTGAITKSESYAFDSKPKEVRGKFMLVHLNGTLIGIVKTNGERSFLALRNVVDSKGNIQLAIGGVYSVSTEFKTSVLYPAHYEFGTSIGASEKAMNNDVVSAPGVRAVSVNLDHLYLRAETFLMNSFAYELPQNIEALNIVNQVSGSNATWVNLVETLTQMRLAVENEENSADGLTGLRGFF